MLANHLVLVVVPSDAQPQNAVEAYQKWVMKRAAGRIRLGG
jgi:hypothetical protein